MFETPPLCPSLSTHPSTMSSPDFDSRSPTPGSSRSGSDDGRGVGAVHSAPMSSPGPSSPTTPHVNAHDPLLPPSRQPSYIQSPLNPLSASRPDSRGSMSRIASDESYGGGSLGVGPGGYPLLAGHRDTLASQRGSMLLYRLASDSDSLLPPPTPGARFSHYSIDSRHSTFSVASDSKYPSAPEKGPGGAFLPYAYDPSSDQSSPPDADDILHDPSTLDADSAQVARLNLRGVFNVLILVLLIAALLCLFTLYPILTFFHTNPRNLAIDNNVQVNATGQVADLPGMRNLIDKHTPPDVRTRKGFDGKEYELVFSDEFNEDGRTFWPGDDPYWEAVDLWYGATADMEWYDPGQITTADGKLRIRIEQVDPTQNHGLNYKSGMLQSWNKFCFTGGYVEVSASFPGANSDVAGYWPGVWIMGNLGRPGYAASTEGMWPYSYNTCDLGTFPNQTLKDKTGPPAALHTDYGRDKYNFELSWLPGQRLSACTCPNTELGSDHPGPSPSVGRGAPEIDVLEAQKNKLGTGGKVSQSAQFAPFNANYVSLNGTGQATFFMPPDVTKQNTYQGSALQQAASALTTVPDTTYAGTGGQYTSFGFEYFADPNDDQAGYITWQVGGQPSYGITSRAVPADTLSQVSQRLIPVEPMSLIMNLGMSESFQVVDLTAMTFPADFLVDYIRVYQPKDHKNYGCNPPDFPTQEYINAHMNAYTNPNLTSWADAGYTKPKNSQYDGC